MILARGEKRALLFLSLSFLVGVLVLASRSMSGGEPVQAIGVAESVGRSTAGGQLNINRAGIGELVTLPGIGEKYARRIVSLRQAQGGFKVVEDLLAVEGIGPRRLEKIRPMICLE
jgi:competence protein ComEA